MRNNNGHDPHNVEAEKSTLGGIIIDPDQLVNISPILAGSDFFIERHGWIYDAARFLFQAGRPVDTLTLGDELERRGQLTEAGGWAYLTELMQATPTGIYAEHYARIVSRDSLLRKLLRAAGQIARLAHAGEGEPDEVIAQAQKMVMDVAAEASDSDAARIGEVVEEISADVNQIFAQQGKAVLGLPTGLTQIDRALGGLQKSAMYVIGGRPGMGKSALALQMAVSAAKSSKARSLIFSLEMSKKELVRRAIATESGVEDRRIRAGQIKADEWDNYLTAEETISKLPILIDDHPILDDTRLRSKALKYQIQHGIDLVIIDYIQLMSGDRKHSDYQRVTANSRACKLLARELNVPVIVLAQLSRKCEERHDKRPMLSDLRDSGAIEADADVVMFLYRDEVYKPDTEFPSLAEAIISKNRAGPPGSFSLYFKKMLMQFVDLEIHHKFTGVDYDSR